MTGKHRQKIREFVAVSGGGYEASAYFTRHWFILGCRAANGVEFATSVAEEFAVRLPEVVDAESLAEIRSDNDAIERLIKDPAFVSQFESRVGHAFDVALRGVIAEEIERYRFENPDAAPK